MLDLFINHHRIESIDQEDRALLRSNPSAVIPRKQERMKRGVRQRRHDRHKPGGASLPIQSNPMNAFLLKAKNLGGLGAGPHEPK